MESIKEFVSGLFLFSGLFSDELDTLISGMEKTTLDFNRSELVYSATDGKKIGFVIDGSLEVRRTKSDGSFAVLNTLKSGDSFGVLSVFSAEDFPTQIYATKRSKVLFISEKEVYDLIEKNPKISKNIIYFLAERIQFLNSKISTVSETHVTDRLFSFILNECERQSKDEFTLNCKKCSERINSGRASIYRAIEQLSSEGVITYENKVIKLLNKVRKTK